MARRQTTKRKTLEQRVEQLKKEADSKYLSMSALLRIILLEHFKANGNNEDSHG